MKTCTTCSVEKLESEFYRNKKNKDGLQYECKTCDRIESIQWRRDNKAKERYNTSKAKAKRRGHAHDYDWERWEKEFTAAIGQPCPVFPEIILTQDNISPDRINNSLGYVHGNVQFISWEANRAMGGLTPEKQIALAHYYTKLHSINQ